MFKERKREDQVSQPVLLEIKREDGNVVEQIVTDANGYYSYTSSLIFIDRNNKQFDFAKLLPTESKLVSYPKKYDGRDSLRRNDHKRNSFNQYRYSTSHHYVHYGYLENEGDLFVLLHEIGHAWQHLGPDKERFKDIGLEYTKDFNNRAILKEDLEARGEDLNTWQEIVIRDDWGKWGDGEDTHFSMWVPNQIAQEILEHRVLTERNAWAYALIKMRELRQNGYEIETSLPTITQLQEYAYSCLKEYDTLSHANVLGANRPQQFNGFTKGKSFAQRATYRESYDDI